MLLTWVLLAVTAFAAPFTPLRDSSRLNAPAREAAVRVRTARVAIADYGLLQHDFPELVGKSDAEIDAWLLDKTAYLAQTQAAQARVNTPVETTGARIQALRPKDYGRALVYETGHGGLIDGKGAGAIRPGTGGHSTGLATLGEAIREFMYEKLVRTVLTHASVRGGAARDTVGHYAVIDWGFDVIHANGNRDAAGMILRQAHSRAPGQFSLFNDEAARAVELTLRKYGVTTAGAYRADYAYEKINVQGTTEGALLDFGGYLTVDKFERSARNFYGDVFILKPTDFDFIQPSAEVRVPFDTWGYTVSHVADPKMDNPWLWSHELANSFKNGQADRAAMRTHYDNLVGSYRRSLFGGAEAGERAALEGLMRAMTKVR